MDTTPTKLKKVSFEEVFPVSSSSSADSGRWEAAHEELLKSWRKEATINLWLQSSSSYYFQWFNNLLTYPSIAFGAATSVGLFVSENHVVQYVLAGLSMLSAVMTAFNRQMRAAEKAEQYNLKARDYAAFIREINYTLTMNPEQRPNVREAITTMRIGIERISETQIEPPMHVVRRYERTHPSLENSLSLYADLKKPSETCPRPTSP